MTVINMMSFGESGAAVADEQSSGMFRKYNIAQKLKIIEGNIIYGGSGPSDLIKELYDTVNDHLNRQKSKEGIEITSSLVYKVVVEIVGYIQNLKKDILLRNNIGICLEELHTGMKNNARQLDSITKEKATELLGRYSNEYAFGILLGGMYEGRFEISYIQSNGISAEKIPRPFASTGIGSDEADKVLARFVADMPRNKREKIPVEQGLVKLLEATNASSKLNQGVGGIPSIMYMNKGSVIEPDEERCKLASEIVEGFTKGLLRKNFVFNAVAALIVNNACPTTLEEEMIKEAGKRWKTLNRILRGYKE